jgi:RHS repeat-associated protein
VKPRTFKKTPLILVVGISLISLSLNLWGATFAGNSRLEVADSTGGLSWNTGNNVLSVSCWFKMAIPSGTNLTEDMTILVNRRGGSPTDAHAFRIFFNINSGNIEFTSRGANSYTNVLIERPYLERWYHVAVVREGEVFTGYADGRQVFVGAAPQTVGDARSTDGMSVGGWGGSRYLFGEVQEVAIYQSALDRNSINQYMFSDQPTNNEPGIDLKGYFKFGFAQNETDTLRNCAPSPVPAGAEVATKIGSVTFEEANQAGEQSTFDSRRNGGRDALSPLSGAFSWSQTAFARPTPGVAFELRIGYSSANAFGGFKLGNADPYASGVLGKGWRHTFETRIVPSQDFLPQGTVETVGLMSWDGAIETWDGDIDEFGSLTGSYQTRHHEYRGELYLTNSFCEWRTPDRLIYRFRRPDSSPLNQRGLLVEIRDFNNNAVQILRNNSGTVTQVVDSARGSYNFQYRGSLLTNVVFGAWQVGFAYDATNRLVSRSITNTSGVYPGINTAWQFGYNPSNGLLERVIDPRRNTNLLVQYDKYGRKTNEIDALGRIMQTRHGVPGKRQITRIDPGTNSWIETYDRKGRIVAQQDPLTNITSYTYDAAGNRASITEPLGWKTVFAYDERANIVARTNALGEVTRWNFDTFFNKATNEINPLDWTNSYVIEPATGNLLRHFDDFGTLASYTYRTNGLVDTSIDANGNTNRFFYDTNGLLIRKLDAASFSTTFGYNDVGWKTSVTNALSQRTIFEYDLNGQVVRIVDPVQREFRRTFDANGNVTSEYDAKGDFTSNIFDNANQRIATTDRTRTNATAFFYNSRGKLERIIDALNNSATNFYDRVNRLIKTSDPLGQSVQHEYDANGNATVMIDKGGQRWMKTYDRLNRVIAESNPQDDTRRTTFDAAGRIQQVFTPLGYPSTHAYDGRGRLTNWVDAENLAWRYDYDGNANITNITDALGGHYVMAYSNRNERIFEQNQDTNIWRYTYDALLRLKVQNDPNGTTRTLTYDAAGRLLHVSFSTGRLNSLGYDEKDNPTRLQRVQIVDGEASSVISTLEYDAMDRLTRYSDDVTAHAVLYARDALGRATRITYPGGKLLSQQFDANSRITSQVFQFDASRFFTNGYVYDSTDRLIRRTYPNGVVQSNSFDTAGRLTTLSHAPPTLGSNSINLALTYAYNRNGNKTAATEKGTLDWTLPALTDEIATYTGAGKLKTRTIHTNAPGVLPSSGGESGLWSYQYDPSGNMTNATLSAAGAQSWALTYDEDNRTTSIRWATNAQTTTISNRYDALGRRVSRTLNGTRTDFVPDISGNMERILCDVDGAGTITAWYIHGSDLAFKLDASGNLLCYHADAQANVIALSDTNGTLLAQYAFTPYGRTLGFTNMQVTIDDQPYRFVGSQGVMEEFPGLYFMRARYYSAEAGVFLSTDSVKKIGPGWKPSVYSYVDGNPLLAIDAAGTYAIQAGGSFSLSGAFFIGAEWSAGFGVAVEMEALKAGDFRNAFGIFAETGLEGTLGAEIAVGPGIQGKLSGGSSGYGVRSLEGVSDFSGKANYEAGVARVSTATDGSWSLGLGPKAKLGIGVSGGWSATTVKSFANSATAFQNSGGLVAPQISSASQSVASRTASVAAPQGSGTTVGTATKPSGASSGGTSSGGGAGGSSYTIKPGDTLGNIAYANRTTVSALATLNNISNPNRIQAGATIRTR